MNEFDDPGDVLRALSHPGAVVPEGPDHDPATTTAKFRWMWASTAAGARVPKAPGWTYDDAPPSLRLQDAFALILLLAGLATITAAIWWALG